MIKKLLLSFVVVFTFNSVYAQVPTSERNALIAIYNALDGPDWDDNTNWNTSAPVSTWSYVETKVINGQEHVTSLDFGYNAYLDGQFPSEITQLPKLEKFSIFFSPSGSFNPPKEVTGQIPNNIGNLKELKFFVIEGRQISGNIPYSIVNCKKLETLGLGGNNINGSVPDLTDSPLSFLGLSHNQFQFSDIANEYNYYLNNIFIFQFNPQHTIDTEDDINIMPGDDVTFTVNYQSPKNSIYNISYQWYKEQNLISGATNSTYTLQNAQTSDTGDYYCKITDSAYPDLEIERRIIHLTVGNINTQHQAFDVFKFYPNPTKDILFLEILEENAEIQVYDNLGNLIIRDNTLNLKTKEKTIDFSSLASGIYYVKVRLQDGKTSIKKILKN